MKQCSKCGQSLPVEEFSRDATKRDGRCGQCKTCKAAYFSSYMARNLERISQQHAEYRSENRDTILTQRRADAANEKRRIYTFRGSHPHYRRWESIKYRCFSEKSPSYYRYGGRGITLHAAWVHSYDTFLNWLNENLGPCPAGHSLDRINNDGNYEPGNLRWADATTQANNRRPRGRHA